MSYIRSAISKFLKTQPPARIIALGFALLILCGAALLMLGRTTFGDPWVFWQAQAALDGRPVPELPPLAERVETALRQFHLAAQDKGEHIACLEARKHFAWYLRGVAHSGYYKEKISSISSMDEIESIARGIQRDLR